MLKILAQTPQKSLSPDIIRFRPVEADFVRFKANLETLLGKIDDAQTEENQKNNIRDFLLRSFYEGTNEINVKNKQDLVIHLNSTRESNVGVIVETKRTTNKAEMLTADKPNVKAIHELALYFMRERVDANNDDIKYLVATNINEWFVFKASDFNNLFYKNNKFLNDYKDWRDGKKVAADTAHFYNQIAKPFIENLDAEIECTHFNLKDYQTADEDKLIALYKIFSPFHLLKKPFENDGNSLDKNFYAELLHIIGLEETKEKNKTLIKRKAKPDAGSLLEKAIAKIESKYSRFDQKRMLDFGATRAERVFNIALELCIVWTNRVLFLKLLESQLVGYHENDASYRFLNTPTINDFGELFKLFHEVLNKTVADRDQNLKAKYARVPYLNSSLFEFADVEDLTVAVDELDNNTNLKLTNKSILKTLGETAGELPTLDYLFRFLNAYDFASEGKEGVQKENRSLINASVLGKVFEKINGYKDGSIYTPGFITMYMCRQAIRLAVVQKFKDEYALDIETFDDLYIYVSRFSKAEKIVEFNRLVNDLKLCDPAVGSGHFLVSALNEILAIKSELGIFADTGGKPFGQYSIKVANDELIVTDRENRPYRYTVRDNKPLTDEMQDLQRALFHEKQQLIENCLFGVDINPNSVKICRLRLWIELLKNAYYKQASAYAELETLPNIDINIKQGNSLLSRFALDADLKQALKTKNEIKDYRDKVNQYKNERNREAKRELVEIIERIKTNFRTEIFKTHPKMRELLKHQIRFDELNSRHLFEKYNEAEREIALRQVKTNIAKVETEIEAIKSNAIYKNAFEWRFEFPEVLDNDGNFLGFDIVIGNPPYINVEQVEIRLKEHLKNSFDTFYKRTDLFSLFIDLAISRLTKKQVALIIPSIFLNNLSYKLARNKLLDNELLDTLFHLGYKVFDDAIVDTTIIFLNKFSKTKIVLINALDLDNLVSGEVDLDYFKKFDNNISINIGSKSSESVITKLYGGNAVELNDYFEVFQGIVTGNNPAFIFENDFEIQKENIEPELLEILLHGRDIGKWKIKNTERKIIYLNSSAQIENYPNAYKWLNRFKSELSRRRECLNGSIPWYSLQWARDKKQLDVVPKILIQNTRNERLETRIVATIDDIRAYGSQGLNFVIPKINSGDISINYLLAILNSKIINYLFANKFLNLAIKAEYIKQIPIKQISPEAQAPIVELVDEILRLKKAGAATGELEDEIDEMVFDLYGLTGAERLIVGGRQSAQNVAVEAAISDAAQ